MKRINIGILAHVDAGKTTLSESLLYLSHTIRKQGRVDHKDAFLDYDSQERERGITIYLKQAAFTWKDCSFTLLDTPGHVDFSSEMERTLQVLDYAIVIINAQDGVQAHTKTIWELLHQYHVPTFLFVNKMDSTFFSKEELVDNIHQQLGTHCVVMSENKEVYEQLALCDESLLEEYAQTQSIKNETLQEAIYTRNVFPVYFGSALKNEGIDLLLDGMDTLMKETKYPDTFGAKVFKISYEGNTRLTHIKVTGGSLKNKTKLDDNNKIDQIRFYNGNKFTLLEEAQAGMVVTLKGCTSLQAGDGLGYEESHTPSLSSYMSYQMVLPKEVDTIVMMKHLQQLKEEDPLLEITYHSDTDSINVCLMGEVQMEIMKHLLLERYGIAVEFTQGSVVYKESIREAIEGVGHYEPLRHYAEVHLLLEPLPRGSGLVFDSYASEEVLAKHWQRLILSNLQECNHPGVLIGANITDMKITLLSGKAHLKHTEGGDFRQAAFRALRQGLKRTTSVILEPYYAFQLVVPNDCVSKAIYDIESKHGSYSIETSDESMTSIKGRAPVICMQHYAQEVLSYTKGQGRLQLVMAGYEEAHNSEEILSQSTYDSEKDIEHPTGSIFCTHGAGFFVKYDEVENYMHVKYTWKQDKEDTSYHAHQRNEVDEKELERIFERTYGKPKQRIHSRTLDEKEIRKQEYTFHKKKRCLLVDGYNMIHSWDSLKAIAQDNLDMAREKLIDILSSYQGYRNDLVIVVFDAYMRKENIGSIYDNGSIHIVYTKEAQTADSYIESAVHEYAKEYEVSVATSDGLEQLVILTQNALRISARELENMILYEDKVGKQTFEEKQSKAGNRPLEDLRKLNEE